MTSSRASGTSDRATAVKKPPLVVSAGTDPRPVAATLLGAPFSGLSLTPSQADGAPAVVRAALQRFATYDAEWDLELTGWSVVDGGDAPVAPRAVAADGAHPTGPPDWDAAFSAIEQHARPLHTTGGFCIALGGDHSVSWPLVSSFARSRTRVGLVQLDAHHDVRSLDSGPSNGTPVRGMIEHGLVDPADIVQIGIHPFANGGELESYCDRHDIARVPMRMVHERGAGKVAREAMTRLAGCESIYLTVDIDVLDRSFAPGTVAALPGGLTPQQLVDCVEAICIDERVQAMDIVEFDPSRDFQNITAYNAAYVLLRAVSAVVRRS